MKDRKVLFKKTCTYAQTPDMVSVKQLMIIGENGKKYLALRMQNERAEMVSKLDILIIEFDEDGKKISSHLLGIDVSGGAGEVFIPDRKIELDDNTADCIVTVKSATYGAYVYRAEKDKTNIEYSGAPIKSGNSDKADGKVYAGKAGKDGITVKPRKLKVPILVILAMIVSLVVTAFAVYFHMLYFVSTETKFLYSGVEYEFENGDSSDGTDIYVVGYYGNRAQIVIPEEISGHVVKGIKKAAFKNNGSLVGIKFESELPVGDGAFENCISLKTVEFEKISELGVGAFKGCAMLKDVVIHDGIDEIPVEAFYGCTHLSSITVEAKSEPITIGSKAFAYCEELGSVEFLRRISYGTGVRDYFNGSSVESLHLANYDLDSVGQNNRFAALFGMYGSPEKVNIGELTIDYIDRVPEYFLQKVDLTSFTVRYVENPVIERYAFESCHSLAEFSFPVAPTGVGECAFFGTAITEFDGSALADLNKEAFSSCAKLAVFNFTGNNVLTEIGAGAFSSCSSLTRIVLPAKVTAIANSTFSGCSSLYDVRVAGDGAIVSIGLSAFSDCEAFTSFPDFGGALNDIGANAFNGCTGFKDLVIPDSVEYIGLGAFSGCDNIRGVTLPFVGSNTVGGYGYLSHLFGGRSFDTYSVVPESLKTVNVTKANRIQEGAFYRLSGITSVTLPDGLIGIGARAFYGCSGLTEIELPSGLTEILREAFSECVGLTAVAIPDSVVEISIGAFSGCSSLEEILMPFAVGNASGNRYVGYMFGASDFYDVGRYVPQSLKSIVITSANSIPYRAFSGLTEVESIELPDTVTSIGAYAFYECRSLRTLVIPKSVNYIGNGSLLWTSALEEITLPFVGYTRFYGMGSGVSLENQLRYFYYDSENDFSHDPYRALKKITVTDSESIAPYALNGCRYIEQVVLDCDVKIINFGAFENCFRLYEVFNGSELDITVGASDYGGIAEYVLAVHDGADADPLPQATTENGYRFVKGEDGWYLIDYPASNDGIIEKIDLPNAVAVDGYVFDKYSLWRYLFRSTNIESVYIPSSVISMGERVFEDCYALTSVEFDKNSTVKELPTSVFSNCVLLDDIVLPNGLEEIGDNAFTGCPRIKKITLGQKLTKIGNYAFGDCKRLFEVYNYSALKVEKGSYDNGFVAYYARAVYTKEQLAINPDIAMPNVISNGVQYIKLDDGDTEWWAVDYYGTDGVLELKPFDHDGKRVTAIGIYNGAFDNLFNVDKIVIGNVIPAVGTQFSGCYNVREIEVVDNGGAYDKMLIYPYAFDMYSLNKVTIEVPISAVEYHAFVMHSLTSVTFKAKVDTIRTNSFSSGWNDNHAEIKFADIGTIEANAFTKVYGIKSFAAGNVGSIGEQAFYNCTDLTAISFGNVDTVGEQAFYNCNMLESASFTRLSDMGVSAFANCTGLKRIDVRSSEQMLVGARAFYNCYSLDKFEYLGSITIGEFAFESCVALKSIELGTVGSIGNYAFLTCNALSTVNFSGNVGTISEGAFSGCQNLDSVHFGGNVNVIEKNAFFSCGALTDVRFDGNLNTLGNYAFGSCYSLGSIVLPDSLMYIPDSAFSYCMALREVHLPSGLTSMSQSAFSGCSNVLVVCNPSTVNVDSYFDEPIAVVKSEADAVLNYVQYNGSEFVQIQGNWYFISGARYVNGYYVVPKSFVANGTTISEFGLAKYSIQVYGYIVVVGDNVTSVSHKAFDGYSLVYYEGTAADWQKIVNGSMSVTVYYKKDCIHDGDEGYWRYDDYDYPTMSYTVIDDALWKNVTNATCVKEGEQEAYCPHCNKKFTRSLGYTEHDIKNGECAVCGAKATMLTATNMDQLDGITIQNNGFSVSDTGVIESTNHSNNSTATFTVKILKDMDISFDYSVSSEKDDYLYILRNGNNIVKLSASLVKYGITLRLKAGDTLVFRYEKDYSYSDGKDMATIENFTVIYTEGSNA